MRLITILLCGYSFTFGQAFVTDKEELIKGLSLVAAPKPFTSNTFTKIKGMNSTWIAIIPYAFCRTGEPKVHYDHHNKNQRWWGEGRAGVEETICLAKDQGIKVMLKPQVWLGSDWIGNLNFKKSEDWIKWESSYEDYILPFAELCTMMDVEMFCIGTEIKQSVKFRPAFWADLIRKIRKVYKGKLTYAANWDEYDQVQFWTKLDYIGVDAYFPLCDDPNPTEAKLIAAWDPVINKLEKISERFNKPILFTEYGYLSIDGSGGKTWELESNIQSPKYNPQAQATCLNVLLSSCSKQKFWSGGFLWKWYDDPKQSMERMGRDHSPQGKPGEDVIRKWYAKM